jgi:hypothetical protein
LLQGYLNPCGLKQFIMMYGCITCGLSELKTPHEVAIGKKPDLSQLIEWGATVWVKQLDAGKLDPQADKARFVGYDDESKGFHVYWPKKRKVGIERDVYVDRNQALQPDEVFIEVVEDVFTKTDTSQTPNNSDNSSAPNENTPKDPEPKSINNMGKNLPAMSNVSPETLQIPSNTPIAPPHQRTM